MPGTKPDWGHRDKQSQAAPSLVTKYKAHVAKAGSFPPSAPSITVTSSGQPCVTAA